ncbi:MAG: GDP-L-fucose synthase [Candidatus Obscuribacterales bacterium]|nr:GDP-L-fucose synthase [Candidatus Obscuribacterales bacterium]
MDRQKTVYVAGHAGMVGSAIVRDLRARGFENLVLKTRDELDLTRQRDVEEFFASQKIDYVLIAAAKVGGIEANSRAQAEFLYQNLSIETNLIHCAYQAKVEKLLFLGSSCIYPRLSEQPIKESSLLTGPLEPTNEGYAIAKIAGLKLCEMYQRQYEVRFISAMPTNLYGINDNFDPNNSHVIPGMMRRFHEARIRNLPEVTVWGDGSPMREFLHADDLAAALYTLMTSYEDAQTVNVGSGKDCSIADLAALMKEITGFKGTITFDTTKPGGTPRKLLDVEKIFALGWRPAIELKEGLSKVYAWALENKVFDSVVTAR